ncbi:AAA family ATPase [Candidatus Poribacteria bacterium]|nr:AAA family ATPase [Candidatus Poribacteria bacterium]
MVDKSKSQKLKWLQRLTHDEFLEQALLPLFKRMGYEKIAYRHPEGKNLDAMFRYEDSFGEIIYAFLQAKLPSLSSDNLDIQSEILANFERTFADEHSAEFKSKECIIATSGQIDNEVVQAIQRFCSEYHYDVRLLDGEKILQSAEKYGINQALEENISEDGFYGMIGRNPQMLELFDLIKRVAQTDASVLIMGETGTGKEVVAHAIHRLSRRRSGPFISISCATIPEVLIESELFGIASGAATGVRSRGGIFERADGGTLYFNEVGEIPLKFQPKLLRALSERTFRRVGETREISFDARFIASTNRNLESLVMEGQFRADLYYRINVISIYLPPLRERKEDIPLLVNHFISKYANEYVSRDITISQQALEFLESYEWPGNVRELENMISKAIVLAGDKKVMTVEDFHSLKERYIIQKPKETKTSTFTIDTFIKVTTQEKQENSQKVKEFLQKAGFFIGDEMNATQFSVSSDNPALKRYGAIPVKILHHSKPTPESIREFYSDCKFNGVAENGLGFITVPPQLDTAVALQMFVHRSESGFTIVPFTIYAIERALYEDRCLKEVFDTIKLWKGETDLFGLSTPIRDPLWFFGREKVIDEIQEYIQSLQFVGIWGVRKVGKTSLLYQLMQKLRNDVHAYVDLQSVSSNVGALFSKVLDGFERDIKLKFPDIKLPRLRKTFKKTSDGIISEFTDAIVKLHDRVEGKRNNAKFILFIDEVDRLFPNKKGDVSGFSEYGSFLATIRGLSQNYGFFVCIASGVEPTINLALLPGVGSIENPTYNFFKEVYLSYFERQEIDEMIERIASQLGIAFTESALNFVYERTCGHPYLSRLLCSAIMKIREKKPKITINEARQGLKFLLSSPVFTEGVRHLRWLWDYLSDEEKEIIRKAKANELGAFLSANDEKERLKEAVNKLIRLGYLKPEVMATSATEEGYRILPPIFEKYLVGMGLI